MVFTQDKELALGRMVFRNLENASGKFSGLSLPHAIFINSRWPPDLQGNALQTAIEDFLSAPHPGLVGVAVDSGEERSFWTVTREGLNNTVYTHGCLSFLN